jgi:hypothetical protein
MVGLAAAVLTAVAALGLHLSPIYRAAGERFGADATAPTIDDDAADPGIDDEDQPPTQGGGTGGHSGQAPGQGGTPPGHGGVPPGQSGPSRP